MNKGEAELSYWMGRYQTENHSFRNDHYEYFYTEYFSLDKSYYSGKRVLDIGCGPRGSLEWADNTLDRIGIDPLANDYMQFDISKLKMTYILSGSEHIPFPDNYFDIITSFNSLDHVDDLDATIEQIKLKLKQKGLFLLMTEVNHEPTPTEPIVFDFSVVSKFLPEFELRDERHYEKLSEAGTYGVDIFPPYDHNNLTQRYGILTAKFMKR